MSQVFSFASSGDVVAMSSFQLGGLVSMSVGVGIAVGIYFGYKWTKAAAIKSIRELNAPKTVLQAQVESWAKEPTAPPREGAPRSPSYVAALTKLNRLIQIYYQLQCKRAQLWGTTPPGPPGMRYYDSVHGIVEDMLVFEKRIDELRADTDKLEEAVEGGGDTENINRISAKFGIN